MWPILGCSSVNNAHIVIKVSVKESCSNMKICEWLMLIMHDQVTGKSKYHFTNTCLPESFQNVVCIMAYILPLCKPATVLSYRNSSVHTDCLKLNQYVRLWLKSSPVKVMMGCFMTPMETLLLTTLIYKWVAQLPALPVITQPFFEGWCSGWGETTDAVHWLMALKRVVHTHTHTKKILITFKFRQHATNWSKAFSSPVERVLSLLGSWVGSFANRRVTFWRLLIQWCMSVRVSGWA